MLSCPPRQPGHAAAGGTPVPPQGPMFSLPSGLPRFPLRHPAPARTRRRDGPALQRQGHELPVTQHFCPAGHSEKSVLELAGMNMAQPTAGSRDCKPWGRRRPVSRPSPHAPNPPISSCPSSSHATPATATTAVTTLHIGLCSPSPLSELLLTHHSPGHGALLREAFPKGKPNVPRVSSHSLWYPSLMSPLKTAVPLQWMMKGVPN